MESAGRRWRSGRLEPPRRAASPKIYAYYLQALKDSQRARFRRPAAQDRRSCSKQSERVRSKYAQQFRFVMVDEYQDTNRPQYLLIRRLAEDPPQPLRRRRSRSVDLQVARRRPAEHPRLRAGLSARRKIVSLERNYRSTQIILDARVGGHQPEPQPQGQAPLDRSQEAATGIIYFRGGDELEEADFITRTARGRAGRRRRGRSSAVLVPHQRAVADD